MVHQRCRTALASARPRSKPSSTNRWGELLRRDSHTPQARVAQRIGTGKILHVSHDAR